MQNNIIINTSWKQNQQNYSDTSTTRQTTHHYSCIATPTLGASWWYSVWGQPTMDRHFADIILHHLVLMVLPELPLSPMTFSSYSTSSLVHMHSIVLIRPTEGQRTLCLTLYLPWQHLFDPSAPALVDNNFQFTPSHNPWRVHFMFHVPSSLSFTRST